MLLIDFLVVGFEVLTAVIMRSSIFWDITPCSPLSVNRRFGGTYRLHLQGRRISRALLAIFSHACFFAHLIFFTLKMEAICSSETSVDTQRTTWRYSPEGDFLVVYKSHKRYFALSYFRLKFCSHSSLLPCVL
jgi:hypothetical protein